MCNQQGAPEWEHLRQEVEEACLSWSVIIQLLKTNNGLVKKINRSTDECRLSTEEAVCVRVSGC